MSHVFTLNFGRADARDVETGRRRQTLRARRKDGKVPAPGDTLKLYVHLRTREARVIATVPVAFCQRVRILVRERELIVDGAQLTYTRHEFARAEGFDGFEGLLAWLNLKHGGGDFEGFVVGWRRP
jgi:hypothetical protein